ncbi:MAG: type II toxin-antitoxin system mRNA interferase toxin, RelE/StbE family [Candidatus Brennerbacteria bacterium]|nr:type II toxin-antitoxin system mRNA interferase toxin, RelE/StbE family [Candidatus Brennerbacteria bacterium]
MKIVFHKNFEKQFSKLRFSEKEQFKERKDIFLKDEFSLILRNHSLKGRFKGYRSINISGDLRAVYKYINQDTVIFVAINTHSNLYS